MTKPTNWHVFTARMKKAWVLSYPLRGQRRLIRLGGCPGWSESSLGAHSLCWFCHEAGQLCLSQRYYFTRQQNLFISYTIDIPPYLVDKTSIYHCSKGCFSSSSAFLWLFVLSLFCSALRSPRYGKLCWLSACVSMFVVSRFIKFTLVASKDTMYVADADVTFYFNSTRIVSLYMYM